MYTELEKFHRQVDEMVVKDRHHEVGTFLNLYQIEIDGFIVEPKSFVETMKISLDTNLSDFDFKNCIETHLYPAEYKPLMAEFLELKIPELRKSLIIFQSEDRQKFEAAVHTFVEKNNKYFPYINKLYKIAGKTKLEMEEYFQQHFTDVLFKPGKTFESISDISINYYQESVIEPYLEKVKALVSKANKYIEDPVVFFKKIFSRFYKLFLANATS